MVETFASGDVSEFESVLVEPSGKILAVGQNHVQQTGTDEVILVRYGDDGTRDTTFGNGGVVVDERAPAGTSSPGGVLDGHDGVVVARTSDALTVLLRYWR